MKPVNNGRLVLVPVCRVADIHECIWELKLTMHWRFPNKPRYNRWVCGWPQGSRSLPCLCPETIAYRPLAHQDVTVSNGREPVIPSCILERRLVAASEHGHYQQMPQKFRFIG